MSVTSPLLTTKLYLPAARPNLVRRPRLLRRLTEGISGPLTLISAPAGFGKTTLISSWIYDLRFAIYDLDSSPVNKNKIQNPKS